DHVQEPADRWLPVAALVVERFLVGQYPEAVARGGVHGLDAAFVVDRQLTEGMDIEPAGIGALGYQQTRRQPQDAKNGNGQREQSVSTNAFGHRPLELGLRRSMGRAIQRID